MKNKTRLINYHLQYWGLNLGPCPCLAVPPTELHPCHKLIFVMFIWTNKQQQQSGLENESKRGEGTQTLKPLLPSWMLHHKHKAATDPQKTLGSQMNSECQDTRLSWICLQFISHTRGLFLKKISFYSMKAYSTG